MRYYRLNYIQSDGFQYIDTGIFPNEGIRVYCDFHPTSGSYYDISVFGCYDSVASSSFTIAMNSGYEQVFVGTPFMDITYNAEIRNIRQVVEMSWRSVNINGESYIASSDIGSLPGLSMYLFGVNSREGELLGRDVAISSCKIYQGNTLIRDYIPAMDEEGNIGMYEAVNAEFKTSQSNYTRPFISGGLILGYIEPEQRNLTSIEYIESNEQQTLSMDYLPNLNTKIECDFEFLEGGQESYPTLFGSTDDSAGFEFAARISEGQYYMVMNTDIVNNPPFGFSYGRHSLTYSANSVIYDGEVYLDGGYNENFFVNKELWLFATNQNGAGRFPSKARIYSLKIYESGKLVRDYKPKKDADDNVGLYDNVSHTFFVSFTGDNFIAGGEVSEGLNFLSYPFGFRRRMFLNVGESDSPVTPDTPNTPTITWSSDTWLASYSESSVNKEIYAVSNIDHNGAGYLRITFKGYKRIKFGCGSYGEYAFDYLTIGELDSPCSRGFYKYSLLSGYEEYTYDCTEDEHYVEFCYSKDASASSEYDYATVQVISVS